MPSQLSIIQEKDNGLVLRSPSWLVMRAIGYGRPSWMKEVLSRTAAAEYLDVSTDTLDRLRIAGRIPACPVSARLVKYRRADLDLYLETCQISASQRSEAPQTTTFSGLKRDTRAASQRARQTVTRLRTSSRLSA